MINYLLKVFLGLAIVFIFSEHAGIAKAETQPIPPAKPFVNPISNKDIQITGKAEINSTVFIKVGGKTYSQLLKDSNLFKVIIENKQPLKEGTTVTLYAVNAGGNSATVIVKVLDKIPPKIPSVNQITDKSFSISGTAEPGSLVYFRRNSKGFTVKKASANGQYSLPIPLHSKGTVFEVYSIDPSKNKSSVKKVVVASKARDSKKILNAPLIRQMPELPRGCEVTSLAMLLNYSGMKVNKMTLAKQVKKDTHPFYIVKGKRYFGNPNIGFVGNMYTFKKPGFGVFNKPIELLANQYRTNRIKNLTGEPFSNILSYVSAGHPVWVINTSWFSYVPSQYWQTWYTPQGRIRITMKEHSVLVTGYDNKYVYFNDPLDGTKNKKRLLKQFVEGWEQYGRQAISYF